MAHIRVVTPVIPTGLTQAEDFAGILGPDDTIDYVEIDTGPASVECGFDEMLAAAGTVAKIIEAEAAGVDAVVIDCMDDPGLRAGRESVSIPVLGPGEASMNLACMLGHRFSVLSVLKNMSVLFETHARLYGAWDKYASTRSVEIPVRDLHAQSELLQANLLEQALLALTKDGADTIILGCTGMVGVAQNLQKGLQSAGWDVPVIDPIPVTVRMAKVLVASGISHSKAVYPTPRKKLMQGYGGSALEKFRGS